MGEVQPVFLGIGGRDNVGLQLVDGRETVDCRKAKARHGWQANAVSAHTFDNPRPIGEPLT